jgi:hypothetical protein
MKEMIIFSICIVFWKCEDLRRKTDE